METLSGFTSETSLRYSTPSTPPYTPRRTKRRLSRSDSPSSIHSAIRPTETISPTKKAPKRQVLDEVRVEELTEADLGYIADIEVVHPHELEEAESQSEDDLPPDGEAQTTPLLHDVENEDSDPDTRDDSVIQHFSRLGCGEDDQDEASFSRKRKEKHARRRAESRIFKRPHSLIVNVEVGGEALDEEAMPDHDLPGSARRLRRRTRGPEEMGPWEEAGVGLVSPDGDEDDGVRSEVDVGVGRAVRKGDSDGETSDEEDDGMDVDESMAS